MRPAYLAPLAAVLLVTSPVLAQGHAPASPPASSAAPPTAAPPNPYIVPPLQINFTAQLELSFGPGSGNCPREPYLHQEVARQLGYDPFVPDPAATPVGIFRTVIARAPEALAATTEYVGADGVRVWVKRWADNSTVRAACESIMKGVALQIVVQLTVLAAEAPDPPPPAPVPVPAAPPVVPVPAPAPAPVVVPPVIKPAPAPAPVERNARIRVGIDAVSNLRAAPSVLLGIAPSARLRLREPAIEIEVGLRSMWSAKDTVLSNGTHYTWTYTSGVLAASWHKSFFFGGPVLEVGTLSAEARNARLVEVPAPAFFAVGLQGGLQRSVAEFLTLHTSIEIDVVPVRAYLRDPGNPGRFLWKMSGYSITVAAGATFNVW